MNYYKNMLNEVEELLNEEKYQEAKVIVDEELKMPYVPKEVLEQLESFRLIIQSNVLVNTPLKVLSEDEMLDNLFKDDIAQYQAVNNLKDKNLRNYIDVIGKYLNLGKNKYTSAILIDELIRQEINHEFTYNNCQELVFNPYYLEKLEDSDGFIYGINKLVDTLESNDPTLYEMSKSLYLEESYLYLPNYYEIEDSEILVHSIICYLYKSINEEMYEKYIIDNKIDINYLFKLSVENEE